MAAGHSRETPVGFSLSSQRAHGPPHRRQPPRERPAAACLSMRRGILTRYSARPADLWVLNDASLCAARETDKPGPPWQTQIQINPLILREMLA
ncbi:unnamed protein product [Lota lota]